MDSAAVFAVVVIFVVIIAVIITVFLIRFRMQRSAAKRRRELLYLIFSRLMDKLNYCSHADLLE